MKKFLPTILILTTLLGFFAPVGVSLKDKNTPILENKTAQAEVNIFINVESYSVTDTKIKVKVTASWSNVTKTTFEKGAIVVKNGEETKSENIDFKKNPAEGGVVKASGEATISGLKPGTTYSVAAIIFQSEANIINITNLIMTAGLNNLWGITIDKEIGKAITQTFNITTEEEGSTDFSPEQKMTGVSASYVDNLPECSSNPKTWFKGCAVRFLYYVFFVPTSYLFAFAGTFFDFTFAYSVNDSSYRTEFITQGWGIMRDFCNMFFIFVMLYIALSTILGFKKSKTREMIINVIIVGLFINFSLFFTKVIIDSSNILARVFYTSDAIEITQKSGSSASNIIYKMGDYDETDIIPMSVAIVNKIDPQNLIINANKVVAPKLPNTTNSNTSQNTTTPGPLTWMIVIILATAINIVGFTVFISVALIFVLRIVGLWLAMIFSPLAFFSYTVPALGGIPKFGYKKWWPETLQMAFLAPVFMFFMYLILAFLEKGLNIMDAREEATNLMYVISIVLPFAVIMVLMMEAKKIAVKFSGEMGAQVSKMGSSLGGMVLGATVGAATGGVALGLRSTIGRAAVDATQSADLQDRTKKKGMAGMWARAQLGAFDKIGKSTFDARNTGLAKKAESALDTKFTGNNRFTKVAEGGRAGALDRRIESREKSSEIYNKAIQRQIKLDDLNKPSVKLSEVDAYKADAEAKEWNRNYIEAMMAAKAEHEKDGIHFDENKFKLKYVALDGYEEKLSAKDQEKQNIKDKADEIEYGSDYVKKRKEAEEKKRKDGEEFFENNFRNNYMASLAASGKKTKQLTESDTKQVRELRSQIKPEKGPLNAAELDEVRKQNKLANKNLKRASKEIENLKKLATEIGLEEKDFDALPDNVSDMINGVVKEKQEKLLEINGEIKKIEALMNAYSDIVAKNPGDTAAQKSLEAETTKFNIEQGKKQEAEVKIREFESFINNKEKYETMKEKQQEIIKETEEKINRK